MKRTVHDVPTTLSKPAAEWWRKLIAEFSISDAPGLMLLQTALESWDAMNSARATLERDGYVLRNEDGTPRTHPAAALLRDSRAGFLSAMRAMRLDIEPVGPIGRPPGRV